MTADQNTTNAPSLEEALNSAPATAPDSSAETQAKPGFTFEVPTDLEGFDPLPIYDRLGRPKTPDEYSFDMPADFTPDDAALKMVREKAHELGITANQLKGIMEPYLAYEAQQVSEFAKADQQARMEKDAERQIALQKMFGDNTSEAVSNVAGVLKQFGNNDIIEAFKSNPELQNPHVYSLLNNVAKVMQPPSLPGSTSGFAAAADISQIKARIAELSKKAFSGQGTPGDKATLNTLATQLSQLKNR